MIIAVDGPAAAGKGTIARALARHFGYHFLDTGSLYRMVGLTLLRQGKDPSDAEAAARAAQDLDPNGFSDGDLRAEEVGRVAAIGPVRAALLGFQRQFAGRPPGAVLDGRDIGTVVCPDADVKLFVTARPEVRALRRQRELGSPRYEDVLAEIRARDARDSERRLAPLSAAADAFILDASDLGIAEAVAAAVARVEGARKKA